MRFVKSHNIRRGLAIEFRMENNESNVRDSRIAGYAERYLDGNTDHLIKEEEK
jgi:hypothetical protein